MVKHHRTTSSTTSATDAAATALKSVTSSELFGAARQLIIRHAGEEYRLRITSNDKLILTK